MTRPWSLFSLVLAMLPALACGGAAAQTSTQGVPNALQGFSQNRDKPVKIASTSLEVRDKDKTATFHGDVSLVQGDTTLKCRSLVVYYDQNTTAGGSTMTAAQPGPSGGGQIRRLEAKGGVVVTQKDQTATGDSGVFDMRANTVTLLGNVVVTQGPNVLRGDRLVVDLSTGVSRVESGQRGRVEALIQPNSVKDMKGGTAKDARESKEPARAVPAAPMRLN